MSNPYIGEIRIFAGNFAPLNWAFCNGQLLNIADNDALFNLIGTTYGGDGQTTFGLPDLRGRIPIHMGTNAGIAHVIGQLGGQESVTLTKSQIPAHTHVPVCNTSGANDSRAGGNYWAAGRAAFTDIANQNNTMNPSAIANAGGNQPHQNMPPYLGLNFIIALYGIYPTTT